MIERALTGRGGLSRVGTSMLPVGVTGSHPFSLPATCQVTWVLPYSLNIRFAFLTGVIRGSLNPQFPSFLSQLFETDPPRIALWSGHDSP